MTSIEPGLLILHGNRLEMLRDVVFDWIASHPLAPIEEEIFLVQSNGAAEWLKMSLASSTGICAATRVELPGRFLWRAYRQMLGRARVAAQSALDRDALTWRLMQRLPPLLDRPDFAPVARFLADRSVERRLQLARRLADLYDQYQVYRADWLDAWQRGHAILPTATDATRPLPAEQRWQAELWRALVDGLDEPQRRAIRPDVHRAFVAALMDGAASAEPLPRRVVLFGASHVSTQGLEALAALSKRMQIVFAIPNPCRHHWADILDGREALATGPHRHPAKDATDLASLPLDTMHLHAHPLLAAWGRQGRDFMRQLDAFDDVAMRRGLQLPRVDYFDDGPGTHLLAQVQAAIRDLVPLAEHPRAVIDSSDRSIVFQIAHGPHREVEILHDQLLTMLADARGTLRPRDIVVMVPDIERFAPSIRAVFGQHDRADARFVPYDIADLRSRGSDPLVVALEWLLRLPEQRVRLQEVRDLLDVPAAAARFGLSAAALPRLFAWLAGAGVRWGLHERHRASLALGAAGEQNSWLFGIRRMLLGYAAGVSDSFAGIAPYDEVGGLEVADVGALIDLFERLEHWWTAAAVDAAPLAWAERCRTLIDRLFAPTDERERVTIAALQNALTSWLDTCASAGFTERVPLSVVREAWLAGVDGLDASRRFMTGGVVFCTSMPLRAVPFEVVCLLGMNDGDFPRTNRRNDFDLMSLPGQARPGDRSRRDDDRYLMLEALLSARRTLYVSWCGRNVRDNEAQPPSVLVSQLRDYLDAGWRAEGGRSVLADRTVEHPLQPFGRRYFEEGGPITYAREWRAAHVAAAQPKSVPSSGAIDVDAAIDAATVTVQDLAAFLRNPVRAFFRRRLGVTVADEPEAVDDDEAFALGGLDLYRLRERLLADPQALADRGVAAGLRERMARIVDEGSLPLFERGTRLLEEAAAPVRPMIACWIAVRAAYPTAAARRALRFAVDRVALDDWADGLLTNGEDDVRLVMTPSKIMAGPDVIPHRLIGPWIAMLAASAAGRPWSTIVIGCDASLAVESLARAEATVLLADLLAASTEGRAAALPFTAKTALAALDGEQAAREVYDGKYSSPGAERDEFSLQRLYPDFAALIGDGRFERYAQRLFLPLSQWARSATVEPFGDAVADTTGERGVEP